VNVAAKDFYSKKFLNVLTKGRIQRPLSSPPDPPPAHLQVLLRVPPSLIRRCCRRHPFAVFGHPPSTFLAGTGWQRREGGSLP